MTETDQVLALLMRRVLASVSVTVLDNGVIVDGFISATADELAAVEAALSGSDGP